MPLLFFFFPVELSVVDQIIDFVLHVYFIWFFYVLLLLQLENSSSPEIGFCAHLPPRRFIHHIINV